MRLLSDHDFRGAIVSGVRRRRPDLSLDHLRAREAGLQRAEDRDLLEFAALEGRILLSHDFNTMIAFANERIQLGLSMPGAFFIRQRTPLGLAVDALELACVASTQEEWSGRIVFLA